MTCKNVFTIHVCLLFSLISDGIVLENLAERFLKEVQIPEVIEIYLVDIYLVMIHK